MGLLALLMQASAHAEYRAQTGNLRSFLLGICIPPSGTETFDEPSQQDMADFSDAVAALVAGQYGLASDIVSWLQYDLIEFTDSGSGCVYYVLVEQLCPGTLGCFNGLFFDPAPCRGLGTYVYNPHARRALNLQVPHALTDEGTRPESVAMFLELQATFLQITGTTRCANAASAGCGGPTSACGGSGDYRESDVAHYTNNFFQVASTTVHQELPDVVGVSVHGFEASGNRYATSMAQISNGTGCNDYDAGTWGSAVSNSIATRLAVQYNRLFASLPDPYNGAGGGSCNLAPGEPSELQRVGEPIFCGGSNTQGREINGAPDACAGGVCSAPLPERFIHLEQQLELRIPPPGLLPPWPVTGVSWQVTIDAFAATLPTFETWVDFTHVGAQTGSFCQPYDTLTEIVDVANQGETIYIKTGESSETPTIAAPVRLRAYGGSVIVGR